MEWGHPKEGLSGVDWYSFGSLHGINFLCFMDESRRVLKTTESRPVVFGLPPSWTVSLLCLVSPIPLSFKFTLHRGTYPGPVNPL